MYNDLIDLSRPGLYPESTRTATEELIFRQVNHGSHAGLVWSLAQLPPSEAQLVVRKLFGSREHELRSDWYETRRTRGNVQASVPHPALEFLAMLIQLRPEMASACLDHLSRNPDMYMLLLHYGDHPILTLYAEETVNTPAKWRTPLSKLQMTISGDSMYRWKNWELLTWAGYSAERRLLDLNTALINAVSKKLYSDPEFFDAAFDLFDFIRYSEVSDLRDIATDQLVACLAISKESWAPLRIVVDFVSSKSELQTLSSILGYDQYISQSDTPLDMESNPMPGFQFHPQLCEFLREIHLQSLHSSTHTKKERL
ncbi:hypothetical protein MVEN_00270100 [Mycena venus]|uniref:Uncharacterized protein n=1 Tax=Mycena venus TaxID=2733690 RepID=A0A8H6Z528_9AGAR|nr:hypothetical protein MVEN_00270100 [Mycena venus]